jgi:hypothetical protein
LAGYPSRLSIKLSKFIKESIQREFDWLECNCGFWVCEWIKIATGADPVAQYRGKFKSAHEFIEHVEAAGGNENFSRKVAADAGLKQCYLPLLGDVGLVRVGSLAAMAIKGDKENWIVKLQGDGLAVVPLRMIIAWGL